MIKTVEDLKNLVLTPDAQKFLVYLHGQFEKKRQSLLEQRTVRDTEVRAGIAYQFLPPEIGQKAGTWKVATAPHDLADRRVEITGPAEPKMIINALNSGAQVFMADFEDALSPTWFNVLNGQASLGEAVRRTLRLEVENGKTYQLKEKLATLVVRPRGLHLLEENYQIDFEPISAALFDFGLYFFHQAKELIRTQRTPAFYLPKIESHLEAKWWDEVFVASQNYLKIPHGTVRATVLIETLPAAFEMEEILFELKDHASGLNAGRWDYIFSLIKKNAHDPHYILSDRASITMATPFMAAYAERLVQVCHRRGAHAIGGMSAFIPSRRDLDVNAKAMLKVQEDKAREATLGFDGAWVAHPDLVSVAQKEFDKVLGSEVSQKNKIPQREISALEMLTVPKNPVVTEEGVRANISVCLMYIERWLSGLGAVAIHHLMEDVATAEISRAQLWQWVQYKVQLASGVRMDRETYLKWRADEIKKITSAHSAPNIERTMTILDALIMPAEFTEFLTLKAYKVLIRPETLFKTWSMPERKEEIR